MSSGADGHGHVFASGILTHLENLEVPCEGLLTTEITFGSCAPTSKPIRGSDIRKMQYRHLYQIGESARERFPLVEAHILTFAGRGRTGRDWAVLVGLCKQNDQMKTSANRHLHIDTPLC